MISKFQIDDTLSKYDKNNISIATICSHSALQIFYGAKHEGFKTLGICNPKAKKLYEQVKSYQITR